MNNTAFGLGIAVTCIIAHLFLTSKAKAMIEEIELDALKLENLLARRRRGRDPVELSASASPRSARWRFTSAAKAASPRGGGGRRAEHRPLPRHHDEPDHVHALDHDRAHHARGPQRDRAEHGAAGAAGGDAKKNLLLTVAITHKGFFVAATGGVLPGGRLRRHGRGGSAHHSAQGQRLRLRRAHPEDDRHQEAFPDKTKIILTADADLPYRDLILTMDAVREYTGPDGKHPLFFDVSLSAGVM